MLAYKGFTEAQKKAHKKYMENVATIQVRTTAERRDRIKAHAEDQGESVNAFINRAIDEQLERDEKPSVVNPDESPALCLSGQESLDMTSIILLPAKNTGD